MYGNEGGFRPRQRFVPVKVGDELDVKIEAVGEKGDGIARKDGFVLFVPNAKEGDEVRVRVTKVLRKVGFADVVGEAQEKPEVSEPAPAEETHVEEEAPVSGSPQDTEDFGEEPVAEEPAEEAPAEEEKQEEEPAEEPAEEEKQEEASEETQEEEKKEE